MWQELPRKPQSFIPMSLSNLYFWGLVKGWVAKIYALLCYGWITHQLVLNGKQHGRNERWGHTHTHQVNLNNPGAYGWHTSLFSLLVSLSLFQSKATITITIYKQYTLAHKNIINNLYSPGIDGTKEVNRTYLRMRHLFSPFTAFLAQKYSAVSGSGSGRVEWVACVSGASS